MLESFLDEMSLDDDGEWDIVNTLLLASVEELDYVFFFEVEDVLFPTPGEK